MPVIRAYPAVVIFPFPQANLIKSTLHLNSERHVVIQGSVSEVIYASEQKVEFFASESPSSHSSGLGDGTICHD